MVSKKDLIMVMNVVHRKGIVQSSIVDVRAPSGGGIVSHNVIYYFHLSLDCLSALAVTQANNEPHFFLYFPCYNGMRRRRLISEMVSANCLIRNRVNCRMFVPRSLNIVGFLRRSISCMNSGRNFCGVCANSPRLPCRPAGRPPVPRYSGRPKDQRQNNWSIFPCAAPLDWFCVVGRKKKYAGIIWQPLRYFQYS